MIDTWNPAKLNEKISGRDSWNPAILNEAVTDRDSWNPAILNESAGDTPVEFEATITASFPDGATCTATDGTTTLTADNNPMAFNIPNEGTWAVACVANGITFSENVVITTNGQTETVDITPVGETYATTDSVPVLIACAGIGDSEITTIAGALADVETLTAILESENAIDYLVRSTTFASDVTADSVAMTGIGAINYDADTLLDDSTWLAAICNSQYFDSVLNVKVPIMTSNNTPEGEAFATSYATDQQEYKAFDNNNSTQWSAASSTYDGTVNIGYKFTSPKNIKMAVYTPRYLINFTPVVVAGIKYQGSSDNITWDDLSSVENIQITTTGAQTPTKTILDTNNYQYFRAVYISRISGNESVYPTVSELQFYGRVDV